MLLAFINFKYLWYILSSKQTRNPLILTKRRAATNIM